MRSLDARLKLRRQHLLQPEPHLESNHAILDGQGLRPRQEGHGEQGDGDHRQERDRFGRVPPRSPDFVQHIEQQHGQDEEMVGRKQPGWFL